MTAKTQQPPKTYGTVIYDGDCAFCSSSVRFLQRVVKPGATFVPYQFINPADFGLTLAECETALRYVHPDGSTFAGHEAYRQMLKQEGGAWAALGFLMRTPGYYAIANAVYRLIAKNRHKMPGGTPTCSLENRPRTN